MEWRGGDHIIPEYLRNDHLPEVERCDRCDAALQALTWDGLCDQCFADTLSAVPFDRAAAQQSTGSLETDKAQGKSTVSPDNAPAK